MSTSAADSDLALPIDALFAGRVGRLAHDGAPSAIDKRAVDESRWLDANGLAGDAVGDPVHHGGAERAFNHYPAEHYDAWRTRYPGYDAGFVPGALGENISTRGMVEADVYVGDVFTLGAATLQIAQPRQPCWKPGTRVGIAGLARAMVTEGRAGWLYRLLEAGHVRVGDTLTRIERAHHGITLAELWTLQSLRAPDAAQRDALMRLAEQPTLAPEWRKRLAARARQVGERARG